MSTPWPMPKPNLLAQLTGRAGAGLGTFDPLEAIRSQQFWGKQLLKMRARRGEDASGNLLTRGEMQPLASNAVHIPQALLRLYANKSNLLTRGEMLPKQAEDKSYIGVDFDGTLATYRGWKGVEHTGKPIPTMVARVKRWLREGKKVKVFTARVSGDDKERAREVIQAWTQKHIGSKLPVTNEKDMHMTRLYDDIARGVELNTGKIKAAALGQAAKEGFTAKDADPKQLAEGVKHEQKEHGLSPAKAKQTTLDHLSEKPKYYDMLKKLEKSAVCRLGAECARLVR